MNVRDLNQDKKTCREYITCINKIKSTLKKIASRLQNVCLVVVEFCITKSFYFRLKTKKFEKYKTDG